MCLVYFYIKKGKTCICLSTGGDVAVSRDLAENLRFAAEMKWVKRQVGSDSNHKWNVKPLRILAA